jgi:hypothetical protein
MIYVFINIMPIFAFFLLSFHFDHYYIHDVILIRIIIVKFTTNYCYDNHNYNDYYYYHYLHYYYDKN